ncbi:hypothetical protein GGX14DRAFT_610622 [Mycena pura]|uniref:GATA-type domain-containing protein n=1 Tax=Mycena pura TaxID=153505 RepID=A0AAD6UJV0_9AGAR|nr:hypothetical protein GGX14DRAFT_610622 [Mycena pura]
MNQQAARAILDSRGSTPASYGHTTAAPMDWWTYERHNLSSSSQPPAAPLHYDEAPPYLHNTSTQLTSDPRMQPYAPLFTPMQSRGGPIIPEDNALALVSPHSSASASPSKHWFGHRTGEPQVQVYVPAPLPTSPDWPIHTLPTEPETEFWNKFFALASPAPSTYALPSPFARQFQDLLPCPSPALSASTSGSSCSPRSTPSTPGSSRRGSASSAASANVKTCSHCAATTTPLWRRDPATHRPLCNACGLYLQQRQKMRPAALIAADAATSDSETDADDAAGPSCSHCGTRRTSVWRRSKAGARVCNACGVYARLRGRERPLALRRNKIRPRCKHPK